MPRVPLVSLLPRASRRVLSSVAVVALLALGLLGALPAAAAEPASPAKPFGFDARFIDRSVDPCKDFYQYACGNWLKENPVPPEFARWARFNELAERNREQLRTILDKAAAAEKRDGLHQKIGDYYASCMDESRAEKDGARPLLPAFDRIAGLKDAAAAVVEAAHLRRTGIPALFTIDSAQDARDAREVIAEADQGGLGLPDRDYYTKDDEKSQMIRTQYVEHMGRMFVLGGDSAEAAAAEAGRVLTLETALAKGSLTRVERREPEKRYNRTKIADLGTLSPSLPWARVLREAGLPAVESVNIASPGYFRAVEEQLKTSSLDAWKSYLKWKVLSAEAPRLSSAFVDEDFKFNGTTLTGAKALQVRWKRCVAATDADLRDLLGKPYVDATFGADGKKRMLDMVHALEGAMGDDLQKVAWMDDETRGRATAKLKAFVEKIGYPDKWVDYGPVKVERGSWIANAERAQRFRFDREIARIGKPVDRTRWGMTPPTVNASYNPTMNEIVFPAGILQPPFFDKTLDDAPNFGAIGGVIGHEISHGFDDQGSQYDKDGNLKNWWTDKSLTEFKRRASCVEKQFSSYVLIDDLHVNGKLTLGENIGDLGGVRIAFVALQKTLENKRFPKIDGLTPDQRFFVGWSQVWCSNVTPEEKRRRLNVDPHAPDGLRVNGPLANLREFKAAFECPDDAPMVRKAVELCEVW